MRWEVWHFHLSALSESGMERLAERLTEAGVCTPIVGLYPTLHRAGADAEADWQDIERVLNRAELLGARAVKIFAGQLGTDAADADTVARSVAAVRRLAARAADGGMALHVETHPDTLCDSVEATLGLLDAVPEARVCFQPFDFGSTAQTLADLRVLREHVAHVHLQGRRADRMCRLANADIDYAAFFGALAEIGFDGALSIEFVEHCVVERTEDFDLARVLGAAAADRASVRAWCADAGLALRE
jgi:sugar phosphate isomerase/epimerase